MRAERKVGMSVFKDRRRRAIGAIFRDSGLQQNGEELRFGMNISIASYRLRIWVFTLIMTEEVKQPWWLPRYETRSPPPRLANLTAFEQEHFRALPYQLCVTPAASSVFRSGR